MRYLKRYNESTIYGQKNGFSNQYILSDIQDILLELEDNNIKCRIWVNDYDKVGEVVGQERLDLLKQKGIITNIVIQILERLDLPDETTIYTDDVEYQNIIDVVKRVIHYSEMEGAEAYEKINLARYGSHTSYSARVDNIKIFIKF